MMTEIEPELLLPNNVLCTEIHNTPPLSLLTPVMFGTFIVHRKVKTLHQAQLQPIFNKASFPNISSTVFIMWNSQVDKSEKQDVLLN